jgi:hypothetical protein
MAAILIECTKEEQRSVIHLLWLESVKISEIQGRITVQYGDNCMGQRRIYEGVRRSKEG